nr:unnamed protein product [Spirometra erinaceieuropaei]
MHFQSRISATSIHELLFTDDCASDATPEEDVQDSIYLSDAACDNFDLVINIEKTVVMHQPPTDAAWVVP